MNPEDIWIVVIRLHQENDGFEDVGQYLTMARLEERSSRNMI
jgi:hypothetical protein